MSGSLHAWYGLRDLAALASREAALSGRLDLSKLTRLVSLLRSDEGTVEATLRFRQRRDGWLAVELDYRANVELICQRCLEPLRHEMGERVDLVVADEGASPTNVPAGYEPYELTRGRLNPGELVEDELIVAVPLVPKHERVEDCGGLARMRAEPG
jgi:uncharacterized protein